MMRRFVILTAVICVVVFFKSIVANPIHVFVTAQDETSIGEAWQPQQQKRQQQQHQRDGDAVSPSRRRILMTDGRRLLNFTNDDTTPMIECHWIDDADDDDDDDNDVIRRHVLSRRLPESEDEVFGVRRTYEDRNGALFAGWRRACEETAKKDASLEIIRKKRAVSLRVSVKWSIHFSICKKS